MYHIMAAKVEVVTVFFVLLLQDMGLSVWGKTINMDTHMRKRSVASVMQMSRFFEQMKLERSFATVMEMI